MMLILLGCCFSIVVRASWQEIPWDVVAEDGFGEIRGDRKRRKVVEVAESDFVVDLLGFDQPEYSEGSLSHNSERDEEELPENEVVSTNSSTGEPDEKMIILQGMLKYPTLTCFPLMKTLFGGIQQWECNYYLKTKLRGKISRCVYEEMKLRFAVEGAAYVPQAAQLDARCGKAFKQSGPGLKAWLDIVIGPNQRPKTIDRTYVEMTPEQFALLLKAEIERTDAASNLVANPVVMPEQVVLPTSSIADKTSFLLLMKKNPTALFPQIWDTYSKMPHNMSIGQGLNYYSKTRLRSRLSRCVYEELRKVAAAGRRSNWMPISRKRINRKCVAFKSLGDWDMWMKIVIAPGETPIALGSDRVEMTPTQFDAMLDSLIEKQEEI